MTFNLSAKASTNIKLSEEFVVGCVYITLRLKELWKVRNSNRLERLIKLCRCSTSIATKTIKKGVHNTFFSIKLRPPKPLSSIATKTIDLSHQNSKTLTIASHQNLQSEVGYQNPQDFINKDHQNPREPLRQYFLKLWLILYNLNMAIPSNFNSLWSRFCLEVKGRDITNTCNGYWL